MKKLLLLAVLVFMTLSTQARKVMFRVNMTGQTVNADGVHLVGNFKDVNYDQVFENPSLINWDPTAYTMTDPNADGIYTIVLDLADSLTYEFKFVNDNDFAGAENVPSASQVGGGNSNRWIYIKNTTATDTLMLEAISFGGNAPAGMKVIKFQVDMAKVPSVSGNGVHVAGNFQGWDPSKTQLVNYNGNGSYAGTVYSVLGYALDNAGVEYKFVNGNAWGSDESVPSGCANGGGNRFIASVTADTVIAKVCYALCTACPAAPIPVYNVTLQVDMATTCAFDSVDVAGGKLNNWAGGDRLLPITAGSSIHTITMALDSGEIEYKFRKLLNGNTGWEGVANRRANLTSDTTLALVCFDQDTLCTPLPAPADVRFIVDLSSEIPDPNGDVFVMGNFTEPNWQGGALKMTPIVGQIGIYEFTVAAMCPGTFAFKFSNGPVSNSANEENFPNAADRGCVVANGVGGFNRLYTRVDGAPKTVGFVFNSCAAAVVVGVNDTKLGANSVGLYPNPTEGNTTILFNDNSAVRQINITDLAGRTVATYANVSGSEFSFSTSNLNAGLYFVSITNNNNEAATVKLMVR